ncbi:MAG: hypothetical protein HYZ34_12450 [Ignavibacteriae bacterium]|nr:hypothetical protein [Ignavibacteriota bacterium]
MAHSHVQFDWRWLGIGFCFLVVFHLLPSFLIGVLTVRNELMMYLWLFSGFSLVSGYIGYRTQGESLLESAFASTIYLMLLSYALPGILKTKGEITVVFVLIGIACVFVISAMSVYVGNVLRRKQQTNPE